MNNSPINSTINSTTVVELADASSLNGLKLNVFIVFFQRSIVLQNLQLKNQYKKDTSLQAQILTIQKSKQKNLKNRL